MNRLAVIVASICALPGFAQDDAGARLLAQGYDRLDCVFRERCVLGQPCARHYDRVLWYIDDDAGTAYRETRSGRLRRGLVLRDVRWSDLSRARHIVMPLREAVGSQMTMFHDGTAIHTVQYAGGGGSGQMFRGRCERIDTEDAG